MKKYILFITLLLLAACATEAQRQYAKINEEIKQGLNEGMACEMKVYNNPEYAPIVPHFPSPEKLGTPTMAQLADDSRPTKNESKLLTQHHDDLIPCREAVLNILASISPDLASIMADEIVENDKVILKLVKRKITWGKANKRRMEAIKEAQEKAKPIIQQIYSNLAANHQAELTQRAETIQAWAAVLQAWEERHNNNSQYTQPVQPVQVQQVQPTTTNCRVIGNIVRCNSY